MKKRTSNQFRIASFGLILLMVVFVNNGESVAKASSTNIDLSSVTSCPTLTGEVRLYSLLNCGGSYVYVTSPNLYTLGSLNHNGNSIAIPNGWSVKLYKSTSEYSPSAYFIATDTDLWDNDFYDGSTVANQAVYMRVYDNPSFTLPDDATVVSLEAPSIVGTNRSFTVTVTLKNTGTTTWQPGTYWLQNLTMPMGANIQQSLTTSVPPNVQYSWIIPMQSGLMVGGVHSRWILVHQSYYPFEDMIDMSIQIWNVDPPVMPTNLRVTGSTWNSITIAWNSALWADGYKIYKWHDIDSVWDYYYYSSVGAGIGNFTDASVQCGSVDYSYKISAYNTYGESPLTEPVTGTTAECPIFTDWIYLPMLIK